MANIIIKGKHGMGDTRSEQESNMRKEWGATMSDENLHKLKYIEKEVKKQTGSKKNFISQANVEDLKSKVD